MFGGLVVVGGGPDVRAAAVLAEPGAAEAVSSPDADTRHGGWVGSPTQVAAALTALEQSAGEPVRWAVWTSRDTVLALLPHGLRLSRCWDVAEVHRVLHGGWAADPATTWAAAHGLDPAGIPAPPRGDLFDALLDLEAHPGTSTSTGPDAGPASDAGRTSGAAAADSPVTAGGYLRADAFTGWATTDGRILELARAVAQLAAQQRDSLTALADVGARAAATAVSESAAAVLAAELEADGLPIDRAVATQIIAEHVGPRPRDDAEAARTRAARDAQVLRHTPGHERTDLRNPAQVLALLQASGVPVRSTRKWELDPYRAVSPLVEALLRWRADERIATTYGYRWLDTAVGPDDRLRGVWTACDGAAGRMTAGNGLHNLPAILRPAVAAEPGHLLVRADLGQIEPRVLAAVSGDRAFAAATRADDLYAPVAERLEVERPVAKVAVLAAMYGQRSGPAAAALAGLERAYPVAMRMLDEAYAAGRARRPIRTFGGRLLRLDTALAPTEPTQRAARPGGEPDQGPIDDGALTLEATDARGRIDAARGRFARNAIIQGAAAELFKAWACTVRPMVAPLGGRIVLCLHDELLVHVPAEHADEALAAVHAALTDSARRWTGGEAVRFVADASIVHRWSEAK